MDRHNNPIQVKSSTPLLSTVVSCPPKIRSSGKVSVALPTKPASDSNSVSQDHSPQRRDQVVFGKGHSGSLHVVQPARSQGSGSQTKPNRQCTGIFVSRFSPHTTTSQIQQHVRRETGMSVWAEKLETRFNTYSSFFIRSDRRLRDQLMLPDIWPEGFFLTNYYLYISDSVCL